MTDEPPPRSTIEAAAQVSNTLVRSMAANPIILGFVLLNVVFMALTFVVSRETRAADHKEMQVLLDRCVPFRGNGGAVTPGQ
jgi:hypothetical protein